MQPESRSDSFPETPRGWSRLALDQPTPYQVAVGPARYSGEVWIASRWPPTGLPPLPPDRAFRIVVLTQPQKLPPTPLSDRRIVVLAPAWPVAPSARGTAGPGAVREEPAGYQTERQPWQIAYARGAVYGLLAGKLEPERLFSQRSSLKRVLDRVALALVVSRVSPTVEKADAVDWERVRQHLEAIARALGLKEGWYTSEAQLSKALQELAARSRRGASVLEQLATALGQAQDEAMARSLQRLQEMCQARGSAAFVVGILAAYPQPEELRRDLELLVRLERLVGVPNEMALVKRYLDGVELTPELEELSLDKMGLLGQLDLPALVESPHSWLSTRSVFEWFRSRYVQAYWRHHAEVERERTRLSREIERAAPSFRALERLDTITELGSPVGKGLAADLEAIKRKIAPCGVELTAALLETQARCPGCGLSLAEQVPASAAQELLHRLDQALSDQCRRLGSEAVRRILARPREPRLEQLLRMVQVADLTALATLLDDEVAGFIRRFLEEGRPRVPLGPVVAQLAEKHPEASEANVDEVVESFRQMLSAAVERAKKANG